MAKLLKEKLRVKLEELATIIDEVNQSGFVIEFQMGLNPMGKNVIARLNLAKHY